MKRLLVLAVCGVMVGPAAGQPKPLLDLGRASQGPAAGGDSAGRALAGSLRQRASELAGAEAVGEARAGVRLLCAALLESANTMGQDGSERAVLARTLVRGLDEIDAAAAALAPEALAELNASLAGAPDLLKDTGADPWKVARDALAPLVPAPGPQETLDAWGVAAGGDAELSGLAALPGMTDESRRNLDELAAMLKDAMGRPAYAPSARSLAALLRSAAAVDTLPAWAGQDVRISLGARVGNAVSALVHGDDPRAARDDLVAIGRELSLARDTGAVDTGAVASKVQHALNAALLAPEGQDRSARLKNAARLVALLRGAQDLPDEKTLVRPARPAYRVLRTTLTGTRARVLLALPDVLDKALAMTDPGVVAAVAAHREALDEAALLVRASAIVADPHPGAEPSVSDRWKPIADRLLKLGQEMGRPESRSRAMDAHHALLLQITRLAQLPGEGELEAVARGLSSAGLHADSWGVVTGGKARELSTRIGTARSRWLVGIAGKGQASEQDIATLESLRELMTVLSALAALDTGPDGRPGAGFATLQGWAGWELSPEAASAHGAATLAAGVQAVGAALDAAPADLPAKVGGLRSQAGALLLAGELARRAAARGITPVPVLREAAIGGPPPDAWLAEAIPSVQRVCRYTEESAAARRLGDSARAAELETYIAGLMAGLSLPDDPASSR